MPFWIGFKKTRVKPFFLSEAIFFKKNKTIKSLSVHFIANLTTNPNDNSSQLSLDVYYVSVTLNLSVLEKKLKLSYFDL